MFTVSVFTLMHCTVCERETEMAEKEVSSSGSIKDALSDSPLVSYLLSGSAGPRLR